MMVTMIIAMVNMTNMLVIVIVRVSVSDTGICSGNQIEGN